MNKQDLVLVDAIVLMNDLVADYIDFFQFTDKNKNERLINASNVHETTLDDLKGTINRVIDVMKDIEYNSTSWIDEYVSRRKKMEQIKSILHIGRSYPDSAIKRLKGLRPKYDRA